MKLSTLKAMLLSLGLLLTVDASAAKKQPWSFSVMTFNVENLFDTKDDPEKNDETYLPLSQKNTKEHQAKCKTITRKAWRNQCLYWDWSDDVLQVKLERLAAAILAYPGNGPDVLLLQEVENLSVLEQLRTTHLKGAKYEPGILVVGNDARGIDVAILSRFPMIGKPELHQISFHGKFAHRIGDTRGILQVTLKLPENRTMAVFVVHFPAPFHPFEMRQQAMNALNELAREAAKTHDLVIAGGDFNVTANEDSRLYRRTASEHWLVSHHIGCEDCLGTSYYPPHDSWSFLDALMVLKTARKGKPVFEVEAGSVEVSQRHPLQTAANGKPNGFELSKGQPVGLSDHWPVAMRIQAKIE